jgi:hypothetical protein
MTDWWVAANKSYFEIKNAYIAANAQLAVQKGQCDEFQAKFELSYCTWNAKASDAKEDYDTCRKEGMQSFNNMKLTIMDSAEHRKAEFRSVRIIQCMLKHFHDKPSAKDKSTATAGLKACRNLSVSVGFLNITNTTAPEKQDVTVLGDLALKPDSSTSSWADKEYPAAKNWSRWVQKVLSCPASGLPTQPPTTTQLPTTTHRAVSCSAATDVRYQGRCYYLDGSGGVCQSGYEMAEQVVLHAISASFKGKTYKSQKSSNCCIKHSAHDREKQDWGFDGANCCKAGPFTKGPQPGGSRCTDASQHKSKQLTLCRSRK